MTTLLVRGPDGESGQTSLASTVTTGDVYDAFVDYAGARDRARVAALGS